MRRDLDIDCDPAELVLAPPDRSQLKEIFRRFEFRGLLSRVDTLDEALPAAPMAVTGVEVPWREGELAVRGPRRLRGATATAPPSRGADGVVVGPRPERVAGELVVHDAKALRVDAADDTLLAAYLIEPGPRGVRARPTSRPSTASSSSPAPATDEETAALVVAAEAPRRLVGPLLERLEERGATALYREVELPLTRVLAEMETRRRQDRHVPHGRDHGAARASASPSSRSARTSSPARSSCSARRSRSARILFEKLGLTAGPQGQDRLLDRREGAALAPRRARARAGDRGVARALEAAQHLPRPLPDADRRRPAGCTRRSTRPSPRPAGSRPRARTCSRSRSAPTSAARSARRSSPRRARKLMSADYSQIELRILAHVSGEPKLREAFARGEDIHRATAAEVLGVDPADAHDRPALDREDDQLRDRLRHLGVRALGEPRDPARAGAGLHRRLPRALPARAGLHRAHDRAGDARRLRHVAARPPPPGAGDPRRRTAQTRSLGERLAVNFVMQGSNADIIKVAMIRIHDRLRDEGRGARLVLQVHDELLLEVPDAEVRAVARARARGDVRRLRPRPAARGRRRRRRELGRGEELTRAVVRLAVLLAAAASLPPAPERRGPTPGSRSTAP